MLSPFPGMNPYLENPELWPEVHSRLIVAIADDLNPQLIPRYRAAIDRRVYAIDGSEALLIGIPDVTVERRTAESKRDVAVMTPVSSPVQVQLPMPMEIRESYLQIRETATGEVVTAIEILSPTNKRTGKGRDAYKAKRIDVLSSRTHLVEIDLLRGGKPMTISSGDIESDYRILVSRSQQRPQADLYAFNLADRIPTFALPLKAGDQEPTIDLHDLLDQVYDRAGYEIVINYAQSPVPPIASENSSWTASLLREKEIR